MQKIPSLLLTLSLLVAPVATYAQPEKLTREEVAILLYRSYPELFIEFIEEYSPTDPYFIP